MLIVGTTLPLFQRSRVRAVAQLRLPAAVAPKDVVALGVEAGLSDSKPLVAHLLTRDGGVVFVDLRNGSVLQRNRLEAAGKKAAARQIRSAETIGPGTYTLVWSDGAIPLVEIVSETPGGKGKQAEVVRSVRVAADIPAEKGQIPLCAVVRALKDKEGTWTCAAVLANDRILLIRAMREETLGGDVSEKTVRTVLACPVSSGVGPIALDSAGTTLYAGTSDGALLWWKLDDDGRVVKQEAVPAFHDKRAITALGLLLGDVSLAVGDAKGQLTTWFFVHSGASAASARSCG